MKICVFSDSHGNPDKMKEAIGREKPNLVFFLGDGERDIAALRRDCPQLPLQAVRGNCDLHSELPAALTCVAGGVRFFLTHGHRFGVKTDRWFDALKEEARRSHAQAALFGHTHEAFLQQDGSLLLMNPGSIRGYAASYGVIEIRDGSLLPRIVYL
ncbi:MAG: YfcE family phosphodiesterase [Lachnospiraceae bacterium]|nr:YfcE family phosphodiesterase [Lachnospiraceae bacterium]